MIPYPIFHLYLKPAGQRSTVLQQVMLPPHSPRSKVHVFQTLQVFLSSASFLRDPGTGKCLASLCIFNPIVHAQNFKHLSVVYMHGFYFR